jgi:hypothetical protein
VKLSFLAGAAVGYVLGAKAGRQRYEQIVGLFRKVSGSQTVQSTAGVVQAQLSDLTARMRGLGQQVQQRAGAANNGRSTAP